VSAPAAADAVVFLLAAHGVRRRTAPGLLTVAALSTLIIA
jgi:hypothetical protein